MDYSGELVPFDSLGFKKKIFLFKKNTIKK